MSSNDNCVYLYHIDLDQPEPGFEIYRQVAYTALVRLDLPLPANGTIVLKPNATVLFPPEQHIITHPGFLAGMLDALQEKGIAPERLVVADSQSGESPETGHTWKNAGYCDMVAARGVTLQPLNGLPTRPVTVPGGVVYQSYPMVRTVTDCAFFFNVPLAKCHNLVCTTLSIKNLMGTLTSPVRHLCGEQEVDKPLGKDLWRITETGLSLFEERFCHKLCDLVTALRQLQIPRLNVLEGLVGRDGTAFSKGQNHLLGWTLLGVNEVHVDTVATYLMGLDPLRMPYLRFAAERGLGHNRPEEIEVIDLQTGEPLTQAALQRLRPNQPLMPLCRYSGGYYARFRPDGSVVPWQIDRINQQRREDQLEPLTI